MPEAMKTLFRLSVFSSLWVGRVTFPVARAQESVISTQKLFLQYGFNGRYLLRGAGAATAGFGSGFKIGYGIGKVFIPYIGTEGYLTGSTKLAGNAERSKLWLGALVIGSQANLRLWPNAKVIPYLDAAFHAAGARVDDANQTLFSGPGFGTGVGPGISCQRN